MVGTQRHFVKYGDFDEREVAIVCGADRNGKSTLGMTYGPAKAEVALVSAPCITLWPRCNGDGNFGTMWGPSDVSKAKFTLDINDAQINGAPNEEWDRFAFKIEAIDEAVLDFVHANQLKILGRKNLAREEVKMLQIRSVRPKYDKMTGALTGHSMNLSASKFAWDGVGGRYERKITVCDCNGAAIPDGVVAPGDVVCATIYLNQIYTGVGGDKFGCHWGMQDVAVVCQRSKLDSPSEVPAFQGVEWSMAKSYDQVSELNNRYEVAA